jgi:hypothetical protein
MVCLSAKEQQTGNVIKNSFKNEKPPGGGSVRMWRRPESNRCPNIFSKSFLHAYFFIGCRPGAGKEQTNTGLSWIGLSNRHSLLLQHLVLF